jgi:hypothetical protein
MIGFTTTAKAVALIRDVQAVSREPWSVSRELCMG